MDRGAWWGCKESDMMEQLTPQLFIFIYIDYFIKTSQEIQTKKNIIDIHTIKRTQSPKTTPKLVIRSQGKRTKDLQNQPQTINKIAIGTYISIITLNVNGLNVPTKRQTG